MCGARVHVDSSTHMTAAHKKEDDLKEKPHSSGGVKKETKKRNSLSSVARSHGHARASEGTSTSSSSGNRPTTTKNPKDTRRRSQRTLGAMPFADLQSEVTVTNSPVIA